MVLYLINCYPICVTLNDFVQNFTKTNVVDIWPKMTSFFKVKYFQSILSHISIWKSVYTRSDHGRLFTWSNGSQLFVWINLPQLIILEINLWNFSSLILQIQDQLIEIALNKGFNLLMMWDICSNPHKASSIDIEPTCVELLY